MEKTILQSQRIYYKDLTSAQASCIQNDLQVYNQMFRYTYRKLYNVAFHNEKQDQSFPKELKKIFDTSDYMLLSVITNVKAVIKTSIQIQMYHLTRTSNEYKNILKKYQKTEELIKQYQKVHQSLIAISRKESDDVYTFAGCRFTYQKETRTCTVNGEEVNLYVFEVKFLQVQLKQLKHRLKMLLSKMNRKKEEISNYKKPPKQICFGDKKLFKVQYTVYEDDYETRKDEDTHRTNKQMMIQGRRQSKYGNNLFKYDVENKCLMYRGINETIYLDVIFHYQKELLEEKVLLPHNTPGKAICFVIEDYKEYFIIKAILELPNKDITTSKKIEL